MTAAEPIKQTAKKQTPGSGQSNWRRNLATTLIILSVLAVLSLALEYTITYKTEALAATQVDEILKPDMPSSVTLTMHPIIVRLFQGRVDEISLDVEGFKMKYGLNVQKAHFDVKGVKVDFWSLAKTRQLSALKSLDSGSARIVLSEEAVNRLVAARLPGATIKLERNRFRYQDDISTLMPGVVVDVPGLIIVKPDNTIQLQPLAGTIEKLGLPQDIQDYLRDAFTVDYKLYDIPDGIELSKITLQPGQALIDAKINNFDFIKAGINDGSN